MGGAIARYSSGAEYADYDDEMVDLVDGAATEAKDDQFLSSLNARRNFNADTSGAFHVSILKLFLGGTSLIKNLKFCATAVMYVLTVATQLICMTALVVYSIERAEDVYQQLGIRTGSVAGSAQILTERVATNQTLNGTTDPVLKEILDVCVGDHYVPWSELIFVWIWSMGCIRGLRQSIWFITITLGMETTQGGEAIELEEDPQNRTRKMITRMSNLHKIIGIVLIDLPRMAIGLFLFWTGASFLTFAPSLGVMVTKCIGLVFIGNMPNLFYLSALSDGVRKETETIVLAYKTPAKADADGHTHMTAWGGTLINLILTIAATLLATLVIRNELLAFKRACSTYKYQFMLPACVADGCGFHFLGSTFYN